MHVERHTSLDAITEALHFLPCSWNAKVDAASVFVQNNKKWQARQWRISLHHLYKECKLIQQFVCHRTSYCNKWTLNVLECLRLGAPRHELIHRRWFIVHLSHIHASTDIAITPWRLFQGASVNSIGDLRSAGTCRGGMSAHIYGDTEAERTLLAVMGVFCSTRLNSQQLQHQYAGLARDQ